MDYKASHAPFDSTTIRNTLSINGQDSPGPAAYTFKSGISREDVKREAEAPLNPFIILWF